MKIITCASYHGTGSSAITDFFSEFSNCSSVGNFEFRLIHDPDGIRDLEYNLIDNNNRLNTSYAIKRFKKLIYFLNGTFIKKRYRKYLGKDFLKYSNEYIDNITELYCDFGWLYDQRDRGELFGLFDSAYARLCKLFNHKRLTSLFYPIREKGYFSAIDREQFYYYTKKYIYSIVEHLNKKNTEYVMVDQLLPPSNIKQYLNYFDEIKIFIVDRDPRDLYIFYREYWKTSVAPHRSVEDYCKWYEIIRRHRKKEKINSENTLFVQFEDLVYKYNETTEKLMHFVGIDPKMHTMAMTKLDPAVSLKNTNLKNKYPKYAKEMEYIEKHLQEYLYDFPN